MALRKKELADLLYEELEFTRKESFQIIESTIDIIKDELEKGNPVKISSFGKWTVLHKKERKGRNPQTKEQIILDARKVITFKPSKVLRDELNKEN